MTTAAKNFVPLVGASGAQRRMAEDRAQAFLGPGFWSHFIGQMGSSFDVGHNGPAGGTVTAVTNNRCGGGKTRYAFSGASGFNLEAFNMQSVSANAPVLASITEDPWYVEWSLTVESLSGGAGEFGIGMWSPGVGFGATDAACGQYTAIGVRQTANTSNYVVSSWPGGAGPVDTTSTGIAYDTGNQIIIGMGNDGAGGLWVNKIDFTNTSASLDFPYLQPSTYGGFMHYTRTVAGSSVQYTVDYFMAAGNSD